MLEQTCVPLRGGRFQSESLVAPVKKTSNRIIYLTEKPSSNALPKYGKAPDTSKTDLLNTSAGYDINSVIAELEKRRANLLVLARAAEARAREVEEEFEQFNSRLKQETKQRLVAEQKLMEFKEDRERLRKTEKNRAVIELKKWEKEGSFATPKRGIANKKTSPRTSFFTAR